MEIPECLVADILMRLPIKSILRFRAVCKSLYAILPNPATYLFTIDPDYQILYKHHQNRTDEVFSLISLNKLDHMSPTTLLPPVNPTADSIRYTRIAGCCNGIVLLKDGLGMGLGMCLWNPATQETKMLPDFKLCDYVDDSDGHCLKVGLCFDASTGDFKVVLWDEKGLKKDVVYSLRSDSWKIAQPESPKAEYYCSNDIAMNSSNGMCHWFVDYEVEDGFKELVLSFDANHEIFKTTVIPYSRQDKYHSMDYGQWDFFMLRDCVAMFYEDWEKGTEMYEICAMLEVGVKESWIEVMTIGPTMPFFGEVLRFWTNRKVFLKIYGTGRHEEAVVIFDLLTGQTSPFLQNVNLPPFMLATNYKKSQVRLREISARTEQLH